MTVINISNFGQRLIKLAQKAADWIAARLLKIEDFLILPANIRASEIYLGGLSVLWLVWFVLFDIERASPNLNRYIWNKTGWIGIFSVFVCLHVAGLFVPAHQIRQFGVFGYCVIWFFWTVIVGSSAFESQIFPTCVSLFILSIYVALNVLKDTEHLDRE